MNQGPGMLRRMEIATPVQVGMAVQQPYTEGLEEAVKPVAQH